MSNSVIKFYLKFQNNILTKNLLVIVTSITLIMNLIIRFFPKNFITVPYHFSDVSDSRTIMPFSLFTYCDVYLLVLFVVLMFFFLGVDFDNSMEEISLASGGSRGNKFFIRKIVVLLALYFVLYLITFINIYTLYLNMLDPKDVLIPIKEIILFSFVTNVFIISLSLFILLITRNIAVSISIITAYYLIEESLWRCKVMQTNGILGHMYQYQDYADGELYSIKLIYLFISIILLFLSYKISQRKLRLRLFRGSKKRTK